VKKRALLCITSASGKCPVSLKYEPKLTNQMVSSGCLRQFVDILEKPDGDDDDHIEAISLKKEVLVVIKDILIVGEKCNVGSYITQMRDCGVMDAIHKLQVMHVHAFESLKRSALSMCALINSF
jgi:hypothetical protein